MDAMNETAFGTWTVPASPVDIEYSMVVIDEIREAVTEGFRRLSRGGIEVGGILYGTVEGRRLRIMAVRDMVCEHARGPTFHLSENDQGLLAAQLEREREDPRLSGMVAVGWYLSHTRSEITLQQSDLDTYNAFFPEPWQVTMVIRPGRAQAMRAGFFVRESDGTVKTDQSYHDFPFPDRLAAIVDRPSRERVSPMMIPPDRSGSFTRLAAQPDAEMEASLEAPPDMAPETDVPAPPSAGFRQPLHRGLGSSYPSAYPGAPRQMPWTAITVVVLGVVAAIIGMRIFGPRLSSQPLGLSVSERGGQLRIQWNPASASVANATAASVEISDGEISDGAGKQVVNLTGPQLAAGSYTYARKTGDVRVSMTVSGAGGSVTEGSRFLGNPPETAPDPVQPQPPAPAVAPAAVAPTKEQRDAQQEEIERLRAENAQQADRIRRLERTLTILRSRLGISDAP
jgi:hypothetical protein